MSPYSNVGPRLIERGYAAIPVRPGTKSPGHMLCGKWRNMPDWNRYGQKLPSQWMLSVWRTYPDAGVGLVAGPAGGHVVGVDIDTDDPAIRAAIMSAIPPTTVSKRGQKGDTRFFRAPNIDKSKSWNLPTPDGEVDANGKRKTYRVCDLIGPGRQTLLPPTIHPDTKEPYVWTGPDTLEDTDPAELPELTPQHVEAISAALADLGYRQEIKGTDRASVFQCTDQRGRGWALGALNGCAAELTLAQPGTRNDKLNGIAYKLGRSMARGWLSEDEVGAALWNACLSNGLISDDGDDSFRATFWSGLRAGLLRPAPDPRERTIDPNFTAGLKPRAA